MKKRIFAIFLVIVLAITNIPISYADNYSGITEVDIFDKEYLDTEKWKMDIIDDKLENGELFDQNLDSGSGIKKTIMDIIGFILNLPTILLISMVEDVLPTMDSVVFMEEDTSTGRPNFWGHLVRLGFFEPSNEESNTNLASRMGSAVSAVYQAFRYVAILCFVIAISVMAVKMIMSSIGKQKQQYKDALKNWLLGLGLLVVGHWIMIYMIYFSEYIVRFIVAIRTQIVDPGVFGNDLTSTFKNAVMSSVSIINVLVNLIATIVFIAMNLKILKIYLERVIVVAVLIMLYPIVTVFHVFEKSGVKRGATLNSWVNTFVSQVFVQPIHALSLFMVILMISFGETITFAGVSLYSIPIIGPIILLTILNFVFKIEDVVKRVFSINGASLGQPMKPAADVARLAKGAANKGISAYKIGKHVASGENAQRKLGIFKDEMKEQMKGWGKRNGVDIDQLYSMGLPEARNIEKKMESAVKNGNIQASDVNEMRRRLENNGDASELLAKFGYSSFKQWEKDAKANNVKARMVLSEAIKPGSASKYIDDKGNIKKGFEGAFEIEMQGADAIKNGIKELSKSKHNVNSDTRNALKASLLQNPSKLNELKNSGWAGKSEDEIIANLDTLSPEAIQAIAYSDANNVPIKDLLKTDASGNKYVADARINPIKDKSKKQVLEQVATSGFRGSFEERQVMAAYEAEDKDYVRRIIRTEPDIDVATAEAWMDGAPGVTLNDAQKAAMGRVFAKIHADENANNGNQSPVVTNANSGNPSTAKTASRVVDTQAVNGTYMNRVVEIDDSTNKATATYVPEEDTTIEIFARDAFSYAQKNGDIDIKFDDFAASTASFNSPEEFVSAYNEANVEIKSSKNGTSGRTTHKVNVKMEGANVGATAHVEPASPNFDSSTIINEVTSKMEGANVGATAHVEPANTTVTHDVNVKMEGANVGPTAHVEPVSPNFDSSTIINEVTSKIENSNVGATAYVEPAPTHTTVTHDVNVKMEGANVGPTAYAEPAPTHTTVTHDVNVTVENTGSAVTSAKEAYDNAMSGKTDTTVTHNINVTVEGGNSGTSSYTESSNVYTGTTQSTNTHEINVSVDDRRTVETTQNSFAKSLTSDFAFGREITNEEADIIVANLDTFEEGFTEKHFNLNAEEFGRQLKFGENKAELQEALRRKLLEKK